MSKLEFYMLKKVIVLLLSMFLLNACQTHLPVVSDSVSDGTSESHSCDENIERVELTDIDYLLYANRMVDSLVQDKGIQRVTADKRMTLFIIPVKNNTNEAIEVRPINMAIKNRIMRSGRFIVLDKPEMSHTQLHSSFNNLSQSGNCAGSPKSFSLSLMNSQTKAIIWSEIKRFK